MTRRGCSNGRWAGFLLVLVVALGARAEPPPTRIPGRLNSLEPWGAFLGRSAHSAIGWQYKRQHAANTVFLNTIGLSAIVKEGKLGDADRLAEFVKHLRPDITDTTALVLFEIKPDHEEGLEQGRAQVKRYLTALNAAAEPDKHLSAGRGFEGSLFIEFEEGGALWQLSWRTPEPGVTLYRWSYRRKQSHASWKERAAQKEERLPSEESEQRGALVEQALRAAYAEGPWPEGFSGQVYLPVDCH